jgi:TrpR family trp operon transcriptional repressor
MINSSKYKDELLKAFMVAGKDKALLDAFLEDLLTQKELQEIPVRWEIIRRLQKGDVHKNIAKELKVGIATVTRGANELKDKNGGFIKVLKKLKY